MSGDRLKDAPPHEFESSFWYPEECAFVWGDLPCGYTEQDHQTVKWTELDAEEAS